VSGLLLLPLLVGVEDYVGLQLFQLLHVVNAAVLILRGENPLWLKPRGLDREASTCIRANREA
jgi:hypothetical protein